MKEKGEVKVTGMLGGGSLRSHLRPTKRQLRPSRGPQCTSTQGHTLKRARTSEGFHEQAVEKKKKKALAFFCPWPVSDDWSGTYLRLSFIRLCTHKYQGLSKDFTSTHYIKDQHMKDNWFSFSGAYPGYIITKKKKKKTFKRGTVLGRSFIRRGAHTPWLGVVRVSKRLWCESGVIVILFVSEDLPGLCVWAPWDINGEWLQIVTRILRSSWRTKQRASKPNTRKRGVRWGLSV